VSTIPPGNFPPYPTLGGNTAQAAALQTAINACTIAGWRLTSAYGNMAQMVSGRPVNHILHVLVSIFTLGLWLPIWFLITVTADGEKQLVITADEDGNISYNGQPATAADRTVVNLREHWKDGGGPMRGVNIIDTIDQSVRDYGLSNDAMRWAPDLPKPSLTPVLPTELLPISPEDLAARLRPAIEAMNDFFRQLGEQLKPAIEAIGRAVAQLEPLSVERGRTAPLAIDGHAYRRRTLARRKRR